jgi:uncharacterized protein (TIGR02611 family)
MTEERTEAGSPERPARRRPVSRAQDDRSPILRYGKRILVFLGGLALIAAGGVMLVTPGPGWLAIIGGFALWATEFEWAERRLDRLKDRFDAAARKAGVDPKKAAIGAILTVVALAVAGTAAWWFFLR